MPLVQALTWDYPEHGEDARAGCRGRAAGDQRPRGRRRRCCRASRSSSRDGSTRCGTWIYAGSFAAGVNQTARRKPQGEQSWVAPEWGWAWPANRRILYNRASADPQGRPWSERKRYVWWNEEPASGPATTCRTSRRTSRRTTSRPMAPSGRPRWPAPTRSSCSATAGARCSCPARLKDGPLPAHYEAGRVAAAQRHVQAGHQPGQRPVPRRRRHARPTRRARRGVPVHLHHLPAHRAPHRRRHEPAPCPASPSCSPNCSARCRRSWPPSAGWRTAAGPRSSPRARRSRRGCW